MTDSTPPVTEVLERFRAIGRETECVAAAVNVETTQRRVSELDRRAKALADQLAEKREQAAEALSTGYVATGEELGEELVPLKLALDKARDELRVAEAAASKARHQQDEAHKAAAERLRPLFLKAYKAKVEQVFDAIEVAARENRELQELELAARQALGSANVPGSFVFARLLPSNPSHDSAWEYWRAPVAKYLGRV